MTGRNENLSVKDLQELTESLSIQWFQKPFIHQVTYNSRLRTTGGRYMLADHSIQVNPIVESRYGIEEVIGVLKHELCHYHLHIEGRGYKHGDQDFKELLRVTESPRYCKSLNDEEPLTKVMRLYTCTNCGLLYKRKRRVDTRKFRCGKCRGKLETTL
ncbi:SprT family protein [Sporosarcina aquimarina]|uniref:SprT family protein n=1 Tax=Sporosarcina aquimarina TaxID=114975 RepID=A0ABU4FZN3_9BACL|nr:SprT family protein [Sporosarcina aquimarina]MDW0110174.1 SprT family protein [Sporosarcina aquimarina]